MLKFVLKVNYFCLLIFVAIKCDGNNWIKDEQNVSDSTEISGSSISSSSQSILIETIKPQNVSTVTQITDESTARPTDKPSSKQYGCSGQLWSDGLKFCWSRCDNGSTSKFWNTWCFTTNITSESEKSTKVECESDDQCRPEWKCKTSCGKFSPHWDKSAETIGQQIQTNDTIKS